MFVFVCGCFVLFFGFWFFYLVFFSLYFCFVFLFLFFFFFWGGGGGGGGWVFFPLFFVFVPIFFFVNFLLHRIFVKTMNLFMTSRSIDSKSALKLRSRVSDGYIRIRLFLQKRKCLLLLSALTWEIIK